MTKALVLIANGVEEVEAVTVIDILRRANIDVVVASVQESLHIQCGHQVMLTADALLSSIHNAASTFDAIALPGGLKASQTFSSDEDVQRTLKAFEAGNKLIAAMCASTNALHAAGIGKGKKATSYPSFRDKLQGFYNYQETSVAMDHHLVTSRGPGTAMAWALAIVQVLCGKEKVQELAQQLLTSPPSFA